VVTRLAGIVLLVLFVIRAAAVAEARPYIPPDDRRIEIVDPGYRPRPPKKPRKPSPPPLAESKLGFRIAFGPIPVDGRRLMVIGPGLALEHHLAGDWRILGEYEFVWMSDMDARRKEDLANNGHRFHAGLRHVLTDTTFKKVLRLYVDGELGGGLLTGGLPSTMATDAAVIPHAFVGLRFGYNFLQKDNKASKLWEPEFLLRAIAVPDGVGLSFGAGMFWD
jgi:hypothetical protein